MALDTFNPYLFVSSGEQSNKFLTPTYADGIAKFQAQRAQSLTGLTVRIDPIQEGTGDPSPDNIRPISGRTGMTVTAAGKNLGELVEGTAVSQQYSTVTYTDGGVSVVSTAAYGRIGFSIPVVIGQHYTVSFKCKRVGEPYSIQFNNVAVFGYAYKVYTVNDMPTDFFSKKSFSFVANTDMLFVGVYPQAIGTGIYIEEFQIETGDTATPYTPYVAPTTYPVTWETEAGTVYGGTLDVVSGVLTVTDAQIASYAGETLPGEWISDRDVYAAGTTPTTGAQVVYKLATPQTYQLSPTDVKTLAGFNQIYSDAGQIIDIKF